jgi:hypothetical protein
MTHPTSLRLDEAVVRRLASYAARHPGATRSSLAARFVDEGLRMDEHPEVIFRDGPAGRRAVMIGGPDVWEVVRAVRGMRAAEPSLSAAKLLAAVEQASGVSQRMLTAALDYWSAYPDEVEAMIEHADRIEAELSRSAERSAGLLTP